MSQNKIIGGDKRWKASELRKLPPEQRDAILAEAAAMAEEDYCNNPELTAFEAFGKDDLYGENANEIVDSSEESWRI